LNTQIGSGCSARQIQTEAIAPMLDINEIRRAYLQARIDSLADQTLAKDTGSPEHQAWLKDIATMNAALEAYGKNDLTAEERTTLNALTTGWDSFQNIVSTQLIPLGWAGKQSEWMPIRNEKVKPIATKFQADLDKLITSSQQRVTTRMKTNADAYDTALVTVITAAVIGIVLAVLLALFTVRSHCSPSGGSSAPSGRSRWSWTTSPTAI
jgi:methyl-accepting chemotaxis protein